MSPVFDKEGIRIFHADCLPEMEKMENNQYELAIVDPPYGVGNFTQSDRKYQNKCYGDYTWNENIPSEKYFIELKRVSKRRIIWGANYYNCFESGGSALVWDKMNPHPAMSRCEIASISWGKKVDYIQIMHYGAHQDSDNFHPCGKPKRLYRYLLQKYARQGWSILDTHAGSCSLAIACLELGFTLTAFEIDKDYLDAAVDRIEKYLTQPKLFKPINHIEPKQEEMFKNE